MQKKLLITGFEPFGGETINPSWEAVRRLPEQIGRFEVRKLCIPVVFGRAADAVWAYAREWEPDVIVCVGQAGGRGAVTPELAAVNLRNGTDNAGVSFQDAPITDGPDAYASTLPVQKMAEAIANAGSPGAVSSSAGTYVCNDTLYTLLHRCAGSEIQVGFIHIPYLPQQAKENAPSLPLSAMICALQAAIEAI